MKYDLNEQIFELYDGGIAVESIAERLKTTVEYVLSTLNGVPLEAP